MAQKIIFQVSKTLLTRVPAPHYFLSSRVIKWILPVNSDWTHYEPILVKIGQSF